MHFRFAAFMLIKVLALTRASSFWTCASFILLWNCARETAWSRHPTRMSKITFTLCNRTYEDTCGMKRFSPWSPIHLKPMGCILALLFPRPRPRPLLRQFSSLTEFSSRQWQLLFPRSPRKIASKSGRKQQSQASEPRAKKARRQDGLGCPVCSLIPGGM